MRARLARALLLRLFPPAWRRRYGAELVADLAAAPRRAAAWADAVRTAAGLRWRQLRTSGHAATVALGVALLATLAADVALGVGLDERPGAHLLRHWWGAAFAAVGLVAAALALAGLAAVVADPGRRRAFAVLVPALALGAFAGSAALAAVSARLAGPGAGAGLVTAMAVARAWRGGPLTRSDAVVVAALAAVVVLGARTASTPAGPVALVVLVAALGAPLVSPSGARPRP